MPWKYTLYITRDNQNKVFFFSFLSLPYIFSRTDEQYIFQCPKKTKQIKR